MNDFMSRLYEGELLTLTPPGVKTATCVTEDELKKIDLILEPGDTYYMLDGESEGTVLVGDGVHTTRELLEQSKYINNCSTILNNGVYTPRELLEQSKSISNFSTILNKLKSGKKVSRRSWDKGVFIYLVNGSNVAKTNLRNECAEALKDETMTEVHINPHIDMIMPDKSILSGWNPNVMDLLALDWYVVE